jgi:hypothetical protein
MISTREATLIERAQTPIPSREQDEMPELRDGSLG